MKTPEKYRLTNGPFISCKEDGCNGVFFIPHPKQPKVTFKVIISDGMGWDHVSVSLPNRCATWEEMCFIKDIFWNEDKCVIQYHPPKSDYINRHPYVLHLWRPQSQDIPMPSIEMV